MSAGNEPTEGQASAPAKRSRSAPPMPGWVKGFVWAALAVVAIFVVVHLSGVMPTGGH